MSKLVNGLLLGAKIIYDIKNKDYEVDNEDLTTEELHSKLEGYMNELSELTAKINSVHEELKNRG